MSMKIWGPSHFLVVVRKTRTLEPTGRRRSFSDVSVRFGPPVCRKPKAILHRAYSCSTSVMAVLMVLARSSCVIDEMMRAGQAIMAKSRSTGQIPFGPTVEFTAKTAILKHSESDVSVDRSERIVVKAARDGACYR